MKYIDLMLILSLLTSTFTPSLHATFTETKETNEKKKSTAYREIIKCLKGNKDSDPKITQTIIISLFAIIVAGCAVSFLSIAKLKTKYTKKITITQTEQEKINLINNLMAAIVGVCTGSLLGIAKYTKRYIAEAEQKKIRLEEPHLERKQPDQIVS